MSGASIDLPTANDGELVEAVGRFTVRQTKHYRWLQDGDDIQSIMSLENPATLVLPNHQAMLAALAFIEYPDRVLNCGFGLGAFERKLAKSLPNCRVTSLDSSSKMVLVAKKYFEIDAKYPVKICTAEKYLAEANEKFDVIILDIFANGTHARCLYAESFYRLCHTASEVNTIVVINLIPSDQDDLLRILVAMRQHFSHVRFAEVPQRKNIVVVASNTRLILPPHSASRYSRLNADLGYETREILDRFITLPTVAKNLSI